MKCWQFKHGDVFYEKQGVWHCAWIRLSSGEMHDKVRCDSMMQCNPYLKSFKLIARNGVKP